MDLPLPTYASADRNGPGLCHTSVKNYDRETKSAAKLNYVWVIARHSATENQIIPSWTGFNIKARSDQEIVADNVTYLPPIDGTNWNVTENIMQELEKFTCAWYGASATTSDINECRYRMFCTKKGEIDSHQLPPSRDCLRKHIERANYQTCIWRLSLETCPSVPSPHGHGWLISNSGDVDQIQVDWMTGLPAPVAVLELLSCQCKKACDLLSCPCALNGLKCTDMCKLPDCANQATGELGLINNEAEDSYSDEEDDDEADVVSHSIDHETGRDNICANIPDYFVVSPENDWIDVDDEVEVFC